MKIHTVRYVRMSEMLAESGLNESERADLLASIGEVHTWGDANHTMIPAHVFVKPMRLRNRPATAEMTEEFGDDVMVDLES